MECLICGAWAPPDPETGYDADGVCPSCHAEGWTELADGECVNERDVVDEFDQVRR